VIYGYDSAGNQTSITYPGQTTAVAQTVDADNRLASVTDFSGNKTAFGYTQDSTLATTIYPDGVTVTNGYDTTDTLTLFGACIGTGGSRCKQRPPTGRWRADDGTRAPNRNPWRWAC
jgi:YD repeat-containing protein